MKSNEKRLLPFSTPSKQHTGTSRGGNNDANSAGLKGESPFKFTSFLSSFTGSNSSSPDPEKESTGPQGKYTKEMIEEMEEKLKIANMKIEEMESQFQTQRDIFKQSTRALADENHRLNTKVSELEKKLSEPNAGSKGDPDASESAATAKSEGDGEDKDKEKENEENAATEKEEGKEETNDEENQEKTKEEGSEELKEDEKKEKEKGAGESTDVGQAEQTSNESLVQLSAMLREAENAAEKAKEETEQVRSESKAKIDELSREIESINRHCKVLEIKVEYFKHQ